MLAVVASPAHAQPRGGRRGGGPAPRVVVRSPIYYYGYGLYDPFWGGLWSPYYNRFGWYGQFGPYGPYPNGSLQNWAGASARLQVKPKNAEVYVDGYLAGTVDDFDGTLQRLNVPSGEHTLTFYLDGYQTVTQNVLFRVNKTVNIRYEMQKLAAGEGSGPRPEPPPQAEAPEARAVPRGRLEPTDRSSDRRRERAPDDSRSRASDFGTLAIRVQPGDAQVLVDGQVWETQGQGPLTIELSDGAHDIEVRQSGYITFRRTVDVRAGEVTPLNVSLSR